MSKTPAPNVNEMADAVLDRMDCPLINNKNWRCTPEPREDKEKVYEELKKGEEIYCHNGKFMNCPAWQRYFNYRVLKNLATTGKEKVAKRKDK